MAEQEKQSPGLRGWSVALASSWINLFLYAVFRSSGVLFMAVIREFGCTRAEAAWPITLGSGIASITCLPAGFLSHFFTIRKLVTFGIVFTSISIIACFFAGNFSHVVITLGLGQGIGIGFVVGLLPVIISEHFVEKRAMACGISYAGVGIGAFFFPVVFQYLVDYYGLRTALLIMGSLVSSCIVGAFLLVPPLPVMEEYQNKDSASRSTLRQIIVHDLHLLKQRDFVVITFTYISFVMSTVTLLMVLPDFVVSLGLPRTQSVLLLSLYSVTDLMGRLLPGCFSCVSYKLSNKCIYVVSIGLMGALICMYPIMGKVFEPQTAFIAFCCLTLSVGLFSGCQMVLPPVLSAELLGRENTAMAIGFSNFLCGFFSLSRPLIFALLLGHDKNYDNVFYLFGSLGILSSVLWIFSSKQKNSNTQMNQLPHITEISCSHKCVA